MSDDTDARIASLLKSSDRQPDEGFVASVLMEVEFENRWRAARARARQELAWKAAACAIVVAAFVFLGRLEPPAHADGTVPLLSPAMLGYMLLALWVAAELPASTFPKR